MFKTSKDYTIYEIKLLKVIQEASSTYTFVFTKPEGLKWSEGAHTHLALDHFDEQLGWWNKCDVRHFSIMSLESENVVSITTRLPEPHTEFKEYMKAAKLGDLFYLFKVGSRLELIRKDKPLILLSAGVGIATLKPLIKAYELNTQGIPNIYHINIDSSGDYLFKDEFKAFESTNKNFHHLYVDCRKDFYENMTTIAQQTLDGYFYVIGSDDFIYSVRSKLMTLGIEDEQLVLDKKEEFIKLLNENNELYSA